MIQTVHTIGTQGMHDEEFIRILRAHRIDFIIDIRLRNEGQYYKFASGKHIQAIAKSVGIGYRHELVFAPTSVMLNAYKVDNRWDSYRKAYDNLITERDMVSLWANGYRDYKRPCLLCAEAIPNKCHRSLLAKDLCNAFGVEIVHLGKKVKT